MKKVFKTIAAIGLLFGLSVILNMSVFAQEVQDEAQFPEGVIEIPEGTEFSLSEDESTLYLPDCPVEIKEGDTFIVYLQDLPIGYVANSVEKENGSLVISVEKADQSVYSLLEEEGEVVLTPDLYTFVPGENITYEICDTELSGENGIKYENGVLKVYTSFGGSEVSASFSNLRLSFCLVRESCCG